jgi:hypothetical protein
MKIVDRLLQALLFGLGTFYCYPWKPLLNFLVGDTYKSGFSHFWRDHNSTLNLLAHCLCLGVQLLGNFLFLSQLDALLDSGGLILLSTAIMWSASQLHTPGAPFISKMLSIACIWGGYYVSPVHPQLIERTFLVTFILLFVLSAPLRIKGRKGAVGPVKGAVKIALILGSFLTLFDVVLPAVFGTIYIGEEQKVALVLGSVLFLVSLTNQPTAPSAIVGFIGSRIACALTGSNLFYGFSLGFFGNICQGLSHSTTSEPATLIQLDKESDALGFQWVHCTAFPTLVTHACLKKMGLAK